MAGCSVTLPLGFNAVSIENFPQTQVLVFAIQPVRSHPQRELTLARNMISPSHTAHQSSVLAIPEYHFLFISLIPLFALDSLVIALSAWVISDPTGCSD